MYRNANKAIIGEISIIPIGGMNLRKMLKYGSTTFPKNSPIADCCRAGTQDIKMYAKIINWYIVKIVPKKLEIV